MVIMLVLDGTWRHESWFPRKLVDAMNVHRILNEHKGNIASMDLSTTIIAFLERFGFGGSSSKG